MKIEEYIDKSKLAFIACASVGIAALLFVQQMTTPVKSNSNINNTNNNNNNSHNRATHTRTRRTRRDVHSVPAQQGIATLTQNNSRTSTTINNNHVDDTEASITDKNLQHSTHSHLHRRHNNNNNNSNSINNTTLTNKTTLTSYRHSQEQLSSNNTQHNISDLQRSQTVNHSSGALSLMTRSSTRNRSESRQLHERSVSPLTESQLTKDNNNNSSKAVISKKNVGLTERNENTSNAALTISKEENRDVVVDNNKVTPLECISPEGNTEVEDSKLNKRPLLSANVKSRQMSMQNTDAYNNNSSNNLTNGSNKNRNKEQVSNVSKTTENNVSVANSEISNDADNQNNVVVTKPLTVEALHHLRQQGEVISPSSSIPTRKSHEHIAAQLSIPVNALQLSKLALPLNKDRNTNTTKENNHHDGKGKNTHNRNHHREWQEELEKEANEVEDTKNDINVREQPVEDEMNDIIPQTARAQILPLVQQEQQQQLLCRNNNVFEEVQKPKLLISKSVQVSLPLKAKQNDLKNKSPSSRLEVNGMYTHDNKNDNNYKENKKNSSNNYCNANELQVSHEAEKLFEGDGKENHHVNKSNLDNVIAGGEEDAIDVSPIPHQPSNEHSPIVSHWAELSPSVEHEELTIPEHLLFKLESQIVLLVEQIQETYSENNNRKDARFSSSEWCWMQLYNYLMSIPTSVFASFTCRLAKQERIAAFVNQFNKRADNYESEELSQTLQALEEVKKEVILMLSSNITLEHDTHYELNKIDNDKFIIHRVQGVFKPMLTNELVNESLSRLDGSDLEQSHHKRRFVSVTIASDSDDEHEHDDDHDEDHNKECGKTTAMSGKYSNIILKLLDNYRYLENVNDNSNNKRYRSNEKECNDRESQDNVNSNCNTKVNRFSTQPHYKYEHEVCEVENKDAKTKKQSVWEHSNVLAFENNISNQRPQKSTALSENVVHLLNNIAAMSKCKELSLLCSSAQGSHLAKELAELATSAQHVLESCKVQSSVHFNEYEEEQYQELYESKEKTNEDCVTAPAIKTLSAPPSLPTFAKSNQRMETCIEKQVIDEQTPQQQKLRRSDAVARDDAHSSALRPNEMSVDTTFDNISPAQSCPQKVYGNEMKVNNYPHRPTVRSRRSRSNSPPTNTFSNGITETSPNSKLFSLSRSPFTIDIMNDDDNNKNSSSVVNNVLDVATDVTDHEHCERKMEQTNNMHSQLNKQSVFERLYPPSSNTKTKKV